MSTSGGGTVHTVKKTILAASLPTLHTVPVEIIPAPGANRYIYVTQRSIEWVPGLVIWPDGGDFGTLAYNGDTTNANLWSAQSSGQFGGATHTIDAFGSSPGDGASSQPMDATFMVNKNVTAGADTDQTFTGPIVTATVQAAGTGYAVNDTGTIIPTSGTPRATYKVLTVDGLGAVLTFQVVTAGGPLYDTTHNPLSTATGGAQAGVGVGFTVNVTVIPPADGALYYVVEYLINTSH